ncbi:MAG: hypothetical protein ACTHMX_12665, partial [Thermomicrobiales bacterium]
MLVYMALGPGDESSTAPSKTFEINGPGGVIHVGVGSPQTGRSSIWTVAGRKNAVDVYIGNRETMKQQKVSLHESGIWRFAWTKEAAEQVLVPGQNRLIEGWKAPDQMGAGWTQGIQIWVLEEDSHTVATVPWSRSRNGIKWLPYPGAGKAWVFQVVLAQPDQGVVSMKDQFPIDAFHLRSKEGRILICLLVASVVEVSSDNRKWLDNVREEAYRQVSLIDRHPLTET